MSIQLWGNATWYMMHTLSYKLRPEYSSEVHALFKHFQNICEYLPCPECALHARYMFSTARLNAIVTKEDLINFLYQFHNIVNIKLRKPTITLEECNQKYSFANTNNILKHFYQVMNNIKNQNRAMINGYHRNICLKRFGMYLDKNISIFED